MKFGTISHIPQLMDQFEQNYGINGFSAQPATSNTFGQGRYGHSDRFDNFKLTQELQEHVQDMTTNVNTGGLGGYGTKYSA